MSLSIWLLKTYKRFRLVILLTAIALFLIYWFNSHGFFRMIDAGGEFLEVTGETIIDIIR